jgi:hypothetical protein
LNSTNTHCEAHIASILGAPPTKLRLGKVNKDMEPFMMFTHPGRGQVRAYTDDDIYIPSAERYLKIIP